MKDAEFNTVKVGDININDGGKITNINDGRIAEGSRDAINGGQIHALKQEINQNNKTLRQGIASAFAAQIEYPEQRPGEVAAGIGIGHYDGETAAAVGVSLLTENGKYKVIHKVFPAMPNRVVKYHSVCCSKKLQNKSHQITDGFFDLLA